MLWSEFDVQNKWRALFNCCTLLWRHTSFRSENCAFTLAGRLRRSLKAHCLTPPAAKPVTIARGNQSFLGFKNRPLPAQENKLYGNSLAKNHYSLRTSHLHGSLPENAEVVHLPLDDCDVDGGEEELAVPPDDARQQHVRRSHSRRQPRGRGRHRVHRRRGILLLQEPSVRVQAKWVQVSWISYIWSWVKPVKKCPSYADCGINWSPFTWSMDLRSRSLFGQFFTRPNLKFLYSLVAWI